MAHLHKVPIKPMHFLQLPWCFSEFQMLAAPADHNHQMKWPMRIFWLDAFDSMQAHNWSLPKILKYGRFVLAVVDLQTNIGRRSTPPLYSIVVSTLLVVDRLECMTNQPQHAPMNMFNNCSMVARSPAAGYVQHTTAWVPHVQVAFTTKSALLTDTCDSAQN